MSLFSDRWKAFAPIAVAVAVAGILLSSLVIDLTPRFHFGDSGVFILAGHGDFIPDNRSWTYGFALGSLLRATGWIVSLPLAQIVLSWAAFGLFAGSVARSLGLRWSAPLIVLAGACEPLSYYWSRSFMADSPAQSFFVLFCAALVAPLPLGFQVPLLLVIGCVLISLRVVYFPAVAIALVLTALWHIATAGQARGTCVVGRGDSTTGRWLAAAAAIVAANLIYAGLNTYETHGRVFSTNIGDMEFMVSAFSPLMADELDKTPLTASERASLVPLTYRNRVPAMFASNGIVATIGRHFSSDETARPALRRLLLESIRDHPLEAAGLVLRQWSDYLNPMLVLDAHRKGWLSGAVAASPHDTRMILPRAVIRDFADWKIRTAPDMVTRASPALWYFERVGGFWALGLAWYATFAFVPVFMAARKKRSPFLVFAGCFAFLYMATVACGANQTVTRYLLPLDVPLFYTVAVFAKQWSWRRAVPRTVN